MILFKDMKNEFTGCAVIVASASCLYQNQTAQPVLSCKRA